MRFLKPPTSARFSSGEMYSSTLSLRSISFLSSTMKSMSLASRVLSRRIACVIARSASNSVKPRSRSTRRSRSPGESPIDTGRSREHSATTRLTTLFSSSAPGRARVSRAVSGSSSDGSSTFAADITMTRRSWPKAGARSRHLRTTAGSVR